MKFSTALTFTAFFVFLPAKAQSTWNDLRFGMSRTEVNQAFEKKGLKLNETSSDIFAVNPDYQISLPDLREPLLFKPELSFSSRGLQGIELKLDPASATNNVGTSAAVLDVTNASMKKALIAKYGPPYEESSDCKLTGNDLVKAMFQKSTVECKSSWRATQQTISVWWFYQKNLSTYAYFLSYAPSSPDL